MITGDHLIEYAAKLAAKAVATETEQRSAISRAYYGAYHLARAFLKELGVARADHQQVKICLLTSGNAEAAKAGDQLAQPGECRRHADYHIDRPLAPQGMDPPAFVRKQVESARRVGELLRKCRDVAVLAAIKSRIEEFLKTGKAGPSGQAALN